MGSKTEKDKAKQLQDKCQTVLNELLRDDDNKYCVDCDSKGPRWASWNIGIFLCIRCAGIHRNLGVHISKVKSVNLDTWTPEQVVSLQQMGNSRARAVYEANLPDNFRRPQSDSGLESFIRAKYEHKKYIAREWVPPALPKVNWEKEIDEEMEKQKRKKKTIIEKKPLGAVEVPQLPKPTNPSPKPNRVSSGTPELKEKKGNDLLGLQNGEDSFSGFLSAPPSATNNTNEKKESTEVTKNEEESFFNQTLPTEKEKVKLDKNSILALYANAPPVAPNAFTQFSSNVGMSAAAAYQPGGFPATQSAYPQFAGLPQQPVQQTFVPIQNGVQQQQFGGQWPGAQGQAPAQQWAKQPTAGQFSVQNPVQYVAAGQLPAYPMNAQVPVGSSQLGQVQPLQGAAPVFSQMPNPFFTNQSSLQQQFGNLSIGNQAASSAPTVATNIWQ